MRLALEIIGAGTLVVGVMVVLLGAYDAVKDAIDQARSPR